MQITKMSMESRSPITVSEIPLQPHSNNPAKLSQKVKTRCMDFGKQFINGVVSVSLCSSLAGPAGYIIADHPKLMNGVLTQRIVSWLQQGGLQAGALLDKTRWLTCGMPAPAAMVETPIKAEILFRGLIQGLLLRHIPRAIITKIAPGKEGLVDTKIAKIARIVFTSALFAAMHGSDGSTLSDDYVKMKIGATFCMGLIFGAINESKVGLFGSISAHIGQNVRAYLTSSLLSRPLTELYW